MKLNVFSLALTAVAFSMFMMFAAGCHDLGNEGPPDSSEPPAGIQPGMLYNVAGIAGESGFDGDGGSALSAHLSSPQDGVVLPTGEVYIIDWNNNCLRSVSPDGIISTRIGTGIPGDILDGPAAQITLNHPTSATFDTLTGYLWVAACENHRIVKIDLSSMTASSLIGTSMGFSGDGGPASQAQLDMPNSVIFDEDGNQYVADQRNQRVRKIDTQGIITTYVGGAKGFSDGIGTEAEFSFPDGADVIPGGKIAWGHHPDGLLVADTENHRIRYVQLSSGEVYTIAGTGVPGYSGDDGRAREAQLNSPTDVYLSDDHNIYIADSKNHVIRWIDAVGHIHTVAGTGEPGFSPDGTPATSARLNTPSGVFYDEKNFTLYIADTGNHQIKKVWLPR